MKFMFNFKSLLEKYYEIIHLYIKSYILKPIFLEVTDLIGCFGLLVSFHFLSLLGQ